MIETAVVTLGFFAGLALIVAGVALIFLPAALMVGGLLLVTGAAVYVRNVAREPKEGDGP